MEVCKLCRNERELRSSHLMPKSAYRQVRDPEELGGGSPLRFHPDENEAFRTDRQVVARMLCGDCEQLFSARGESVVSRLWATREGFPLLDKLSQCRSRLELGEVGFFYPPDCVSQEVSFALYYFAASIVWRSNHWDWGRRGSPHKNSLGKLYEESFRSFLLSEESSIQNARLLVTLNLNPDLNTLFSFPTFNRAEGVGFHNFNVLGLSFSFVVGKSPPSTIMRAFDRFGVPTLVVSADALHRKDFHHIAQAIRDIDVRGKRGLTSME